MELYVSANSAFDTVKLRSSDTELVFQIPLGLKSIDNTCEKI